MFPAIRCHLAAFLILCLCFFTARPAHANIAYASDAKATGVIIAVVVVGVAVGFGIYYAVHHGHSLKGCTVSSSSGLELIPAGDNTHWRLSGDTQGIKPGDRIHVTGNKVKGGSKTFAVTKLSKDYGACPAMP